MSNKLLEEIADLKKEIKYSEKRIAILLERKTDGYKELFNRLPTVIPYIQEKDTHIRLLREALETMIADATNDDTKNYCLKWLRLASKAISELDKMEEV